MLALDCVLNVDVPGEPLKVGFSRMDRPDSLRLDNAMPGPSLPHFESDYRVPEQVDVVVIGGGIVGASTALELAERGLSVVLCEKG